MLVDEAIAGDPDRFEAVSAADGGPAEVPLHIDVVVPDTVLLGDRDGIGQVDRYGPVPGDLLREWIASHADHGVQVWVSRLYQQPQTGELIAMDKNGRRVEGKLAEFLRLRDRRCRNPWRNAPIRHPTTLRTTPTEARRARTTARRCARRATTPSRPTSGPPVL